MIDVDGIILEELDRLAPAEDGSSADWLAVTRRAQTESPAGLGAPDRPKPSAWPVWRARRRIVVAVAFVAAVLLSAAAYAVVHYAIVGALAPPPVKVSETILNQVRDGMFALSRRGGKNEIEVAKTRAAAVLDTSSGPIYLWVAPTASGTQCVYLQITGLDVRFGSGSPFLMQMRPLGCIPPGQMQPTLNSVDTGVDGKPLALIVGYVPPPAQTVQLLFANGTKSHSYPVTDGFVIAQGSPADPRPKLRITGPNGHLIRAKSTAHIIPLRVLNSPTGPTRFTLTLHLLNHAGEMVLHVGPAAGGGLCTELHVSWGVTAAGCGPHRKTANAINLGEDQLANPRAPHQRVFYLNGSIGTNIASLALVYQDGSRTQIPIHHHYVLYQLNEPSFVGKHTPSQLVARNHAGKIVAARYVSF